MGMQEAQTTRLMSAHILSGERGVIPADVQDRAAFLAPLSKAKRVAPTIAHVWLDKGYTGQTVAESATQAGVSVEIGSGPKPADGFQVQPRPSCSTGLGLFDTA